MLRPTVVPRPMTTTSVPLSDTPWRSISSMIPRGVHGRGEEMTSPTRRTSRPRLVGGARPRPSLDRRARGCDWWAPRRGGAAER